MANHAPMRSVRNRGPLLSLLGGSRGLFRQGSFEENGDRLHGKEKAVLMIGKRDEVEVLVKPDGARIDRVDHDGNGRNLERRRPF